ncbi:MAG: hypothetical protein AAF547_08095 [Actinomycetota bacterium]
MTAVEQPTGAGERTASPPYFVNLWVDGLFLGGFSILFFVYLRFGVVLFDQNTGANEATFLGQTASRWALMAFWVLNWPHFAATSYRLYRSRETTSQFPITAWVVPVVLGVGAVAALSSPEGFAPWFVKMFFIWSPYHFSGQTIGLTLLYARRAGFTITPLLRWSLTWFVYATCVEIQARAELPGTVVSFGDVVLPTIGIPTWVVSVTNVAVIGLGAVLLFALTDAVRQHRAGGGAPQSGLGFPPILVIPALAQLVWFKLSVGTWDTPSYFEFVNLFHSVQYLFIAWFMQMKERQVATGREGSGAMLIRETAIWGIAIFAVGAFMFRGSGNLIAALFPVSVGVAAAVMTALFQLHHFFVDGVIWKLRNPRVRGALTTSLSELTGRTGQTGQATGR